MAFDNVNTHSSHLSSYKKKRKQTNRLARKNKRQHVIAKSGWGSSFSLWSSTDIITQWITEPEKRLEHGQQRTTATTRQPLHMASSQSLCWGIAPIQQALKYGGTRFFAFLDRFTVFSTCPSSHSIEDILGRGDVIRLALRECFALFKSKLRIIVSNQSLWHPKTCKSGFQLANYDFCCDRLQKWILDVLK